jgi:hypothetical protein
MRFVLFNKRRELLTLHEHLASVRLWWGSCCLIRGGSCFPFTNTWLQSRLWWGSRLLLNNTNLIITGTEARCSWRESSSRLLLNTHQWKHVSYWVTGLW